MSADPPSAIALAVPAPGGHGAVDQRWSDTVDQELDGRRPSMPSGPLSLQGYDVEVETPADVYHSGNSTYTCLAMSGFSVAC